MKKVLVVAFDNVGTEPIAIRQVLESFVFLVLMKYVGRPKDFIDVLENKIDFDSDYIILSCHGEEGKIIMPTLAHDVYLLDEPKENFSSKEIEKHFKLAGKTIINLGCTTGTSPLMDVFSKNNNIYIAPKDYIEGNSVLFFVVRLFYSLSQNKTLKEAFEESRKYDEETSLFVASKNRSKWENAQLY